MTAKLWKMIFTEHGDEIALSNLPKTTTAGPRLSIVSDPGEAIVTAEEALSLARRLTEWAQVVVARAKLP